MQAGRPQLAGNRLTLVGAIVYLLEWVAIVATPVQAPSLGGTKPDTIVAMYSGHATGLAFSAVWFSLVLLGRIIFSAGLRDSFRRSGAETLLVDIALAAMAASVILEIAGYSLVAGAARLANTGGSQAAVIALDSAAGWLGRMLGAPLGVAIALSGLAMLRASLFPRWIAWLGLASGVVVVVYGLAGALALSGAGSAFAVIERVAATGVLGFWVWMLATGVVSFRRSGRQSNAAGGSPLIEP